MSVLYLRLEGPMQSWGSFSNFSIRDTNLFPTKSGVIGICCAALGIERSDEQSIREISNAIKIHVRADKQGIREKDFQVVGTGFYLKGNEVKEGPAVMNALGKLKEGNLVSTRYYLADASFLAALESANHNLLQKITTALQKPKFCLYLGRKSFIPSKPIFVELSDKDDWDERFHKDNFGISGLNGILSVQLEVEMNDGYQVSDNPINFQTRTFLPRFVRMDILQFKEDNPNVLVAN